MISMISFGEISAQATLQEAEKELKERASKDAKKEVKKWTKEGYTNMPGQLPLEKQYDRYFQFTLLMDEKMIPKYISSTGTAVASVEDVAIANSLDNVKPDLTSPNVSITSLYCVNKVAVPIVPFFAVPIIPIVLIDSGFLIINPSGLTVTYVPGIILSTIFILPPI